MGSRPSGILLAAFLFASLLTAFLPGTPGAEPVDAPEVVPSEVPPEALAAGPVATSTFPAPLRGDAFLPGDSLGPNARLGSSGVSAGAPEPGFLDTSRFMMGSVAYALILPESNGSINPNQEDWTAARINTVESEVQAGVTWWAAQEPNANLSFTYDPNSPYIVNTSYEPITHPSTNESLWINEVMAQLGYTTGNRFDRVRQFDNDLRTNLSKDWAFTIFVVDSMNDVDGGHNFTDDLFAYAYLGGPFMVMTYGNNGWGIGQMNNVTAHETGHIFYATDEYDGVPQASGYLGILEVEDSSCIMDNNNLGCISGSTAPGVPGTQGQIGWRDSDGNSAFDILDVPPVTSLNAHADPTNNVTPTYTGTATAAPLPPVQGTPVTINTIADVEYRVDNGSWFSATPVDLVFNETTEAFTFTTSLLGEGNHFIEARAKVIVPTPTPVTIYDLAPASDILEVDVTAAASMVDPLPTYTRGAVFSVFASTVEGPATIDRVELFARKAGGTWSSVQNDTVAPYIFQYATAGVGVGDGLYEFYSIAHDSAGNTETAPVGPDASTTVDTVAPDSSVNALPTFGMTPSFVVSAMATDPNGIVSVELFYRKDGGAWTSYGLDTVSPYSWNFDASGSGDGFYEFYSIAIDGAMNDEAQPLNPDASTTLDTVAPTSSHTLSGTAGTAPWYRSVVRVTLSATDAASGASTTMYRVDGGALQSYTAPFDVTGEGAHTVEYASTDAAGNVEADRSVAFSVDLSPPDLTITAPGAGALVFEAAVLITWTASDAVSGLASCAVSVDGGPPTSVGTATSLSLPDLRDGPHAAQVSCGDVAGHTVEETVSFTFLTTNVVRPTPLGGSWIQILIGVIILLVIVLAVVRWRRRRRARGT